MSYTPKQIRDTLDNLRIRQLRLDHTLEQYEAIIEYCNAPIDKDRWRADFERLRAKSRESREDLRKKLSHLEEILAEDEKVNGWRGEDRIVEVL
jgi:hypothetical protein